MLSPNNILQKRYRIIRQIGYGGMGAVYEAIDERVSSIVALKETFAETDEMREAFEREAKLLANLEHRSFPRVMDYFFEGDGQYLVMEFVRGNDLAELLKLRESPFSTAKVLEWADQLLDALEDIHAYRPPIIHRDIKPSNLKLTPKGRIILLDFGIAKGAAGQMTTYLEMEGSLGSYTPHYASLEQSLRSDPRWIEALTIVDQKTVEQILLKGTDPRADLYSLGATLYHLMTGQILTHPVGQKQANDFGLYDMHGNVWEWCQDVYHASYHGAPTDGSAWLSGGDSSLRVLRGGSWYVDAGYLRSAYPGYLRSASRYGDNPGSRLLDRGFRVAAVARK